MKHLLVLIVFMCCSFLSAQEKGTVTGLVLDNELANEPLPFATVSVSGTDISTTSDLDGVIKLELDAGTYSLAFNFPGYQKTLVKSIVVQRNKTTKLKAISLNALMSPGHNSLTSEAEVKKPKIKR